jgi:iron complex outermembrane receptor protein
MKDTVVCMAQQIGAWVVAIAMGGVIPCTAMSAEAVSSSTLEEVIVTAEKRSENLQNVPMSISAFDGTQIEQRAITSFIDYGTTVPNLGFGYSGPGLANARTVSIRGVAGDNTTGFYLDDTPLPESINPRIVDTDRIEVLRGPQGTLYGARSEGGTVRIITQQPDPGAFYARVHVGASDTWNTVQPNYVADGAINIPLIADRVALRVVALYDSEAGFFRREYPTLAPFGSTLAAVRDVAHDRTSGGSLSLAWKVSEALTITPRVLYQQDTYNGFPYSDHTVYQVPAPAIVPPLNLVPNNFVQKELYDIPEGGHDRWTLSSLTGSYHTEYGEFVSSTSYLDRNVFETENFSDQLYQILGAPFNSSISAGTTVHEFVQEMRFASRLSGAWQFVAGVYYESTTGRPSYYPPVIVTGLNTYFGGTSTSPAPGTNPLNPDEFDGNDWHRHVTEPAVFGELYYSATERLKLTAGLRAYQNKSTSSSWLEGVAGGGPRINSPEQTLTERGVNPKAEIEYQITPDRMVYAAASKGFRPGGVAFVIPTGFGCGQSLAALGLTTQQAQRFKSDSLWNYEIGEKSAWLDHRLTVDAAAYYIDWKNLQQNILLSCGFQYTANVGAAKSEGFELEAHARPVDSLDLSAGVGYAHAVITQGGATSPQRPGNPVYQVPDWTANIAVTHTLRLPEGRSLVSNVNYAYVDHSYSGNNNPSAPRIRPAYELLNARFALNWANYEIAFVAKNLQNTHANLADNVSIAAEVIGRPRIVTNQPRTIGVELIAKY